MPQKHFMNLRAAPALRTIVDDAVTIAGGTPKPVTLHGGAHTYVLVDLGATELEKTMAIDFTYTR